MIIFLKAACKSNFITARCIIYSTVNMKKDYRGKLKKY
jgi:hypothetical protein